jgi:hypothetical protein
MNTNEEAQKNTFDADFNRFDYTYYLPSPDGVLSPDFFRTRKIGMTAGLAPENKETEL